MREGGREHISPAERSFCARCGTSLWLWDPRWPDLVHPLASAIDTELPVPPERTHLMLADKPAWVRADIGPKDRQFDGYPENRWPSGTSAWGSPAPTDRPCRAPFACREAGSPRPARLRLMNPQPDTGAVAIPATCAREDPRRPPRLDTRHPEPIADFVIASVANLDDVLQSPLLPPALAAGAGACARSAR